MVTVTVSALVLAAATILSVTRMGVNIWFLATEPVYVIPEESSIFRFSPTVMNPGSGDWWLYGEDERFFYAFSGGEPSPYRAYPKASVDGCAGFVATDDATWCPSD